MVIAKLFGGLGNQMFIYAAAKGIAQISNQKLTFDIYTGFEDDSRFRRVYELKQFNLSVQESRRWMSFRYPLGRILRKISRKIGFCIPLVNFKFIVEKKPYHFQNEIMRIASFSSIYLEGYFQSYKYFSKIEAQIREDFKFTKEVVGSVEKEASFITNSRYTPVAIGVRRYSEMKGEFGELAVVEHDYYDAAIKYIANKVPNLIFIVFSEDIDWVKKNLKLDYPVYFVTSKKGELAAIQDMYLMSLCNHHIISNSSFYWWGAYLASTNNHIVIAPSVFLNKDCTPIDWVII